MSKAPKTTDEQGVPTTQEEQVLETLLESATGTEVIEVDTPEPEGSNDPYHAPGEDRKGPFYDDVQAEKAARKAERERDPDAPVPVVVSIVSEGVVIEKTFTDDLPLQLGLGGAYKMVDGKRVRDTGEE